MSIILGDFVRETFLEKNPQFTETELLARVNEAVDFSKRVTDLTKEDWKTAYRGYRDGVLVIPLLKVDGFKRRVRELVEGDHLFGQYRARVKGETPRKAAKVLHVGELPNALFVDVVLYHRDVLEEDGDLSDPYGDYEYEVVTFLAKDQPGKEPMDPDTLIANHFRWDGGTSTNMSDSEFVAALKESVDYWKNRAHIH